MIVKPSCFSLPLTAALILVTASAAFADGVAKRPVRADLPGVQGDYRIVRPVPEPDHETAPASTGQFKIGDMDVRISGSVKVDIGFGSLPPPRR